MHIRSLAHPGQHVIIHAVSGAHTLPSRTSFLARPTQRGTLFEVQDLPLNRTQGHWHLPSGVGLSGLEGYGHHHHWNNQLAGS